MNVAVLIPFRPEDKERKANFKRTALQWGDWQIICGDSDSEVFSRARAINWAAAQAPDADVYVISDSDLLIDRSHVEEAVELAYSSGDYVVAFTHLVAFDREETLRVRDYLPWPKNPMWSTSMIWGGVFAVTRHLFEAVGGFDERFVGWGYEDGAFLAACSTLAGKQRVGGTVAHLRHTDAPRDPVMMEANQKLALRWREAEGNMDKMLALIEEGR